MAKHYPNSACGDKVQQQKLWTGTGVLVWLMLSCMRNLKILAIRSRAACCLEVQVRTC